MGAKIDGYRINLLYNLMALKGTLKVAHIPSFPILIEIGSFIGMAAMTESAITIKRCLLR